MRNDLCRLVIYRHLIFVLHTFTSKLENRCFMVVSCAKSGGVNAMTNDEVDAPALSTSSIIPRGYLSVQMVDHESQFVRTHSYTKLAIYGRSR